VPEQKKQADHDQDQAGDVAVAFFLADHHAGAADHEGDRPERQRMAKADVTKVIEQEQYPHRDHQQADHDLAEGAAAFIRHDDAPAAR
jgi:hypothetical protein